MQIFMSSAEFEINSNLMNKLFGYPKYFESGQFFNLNSSEIKERQSRQISLKFEDIDKLNTWEEYKINIKTYYNSATHLDKDVNNQWWAICPGTGYCYMFTCSLGNYKI